MLICWFSAVRYTVKLRNHKYVIPCTRPSPSPPSSSEKSPPPEEMAAEHNSLRYPWSWPLHPIPPGLPEAGSQAPLRPHRGHPLWTTPAPLTFTVPAYTLTAQLADCKGRLEPKLLSHYFFSRCHSLLSTMPSRWWYCFSLQIPYSSCFAKQKCLAWFLILQLLKAQTVRKVLLWPQGGVGSFPIHTGQNFMLYFLCWNRLDNRD